MGKSNATALAVCCADDDASDNVTSDVNAPREPLKRNEQLVYDALRRSETPIKAYDLLETLRDRGLRAPMTIYRALDALVAKGCVKKISSLNAYVAHRYDGSSSASAFLICRTCMHAKEISLSEAQVANLFSPTPVAAEDVRIEVFADCLQVCDESNRVVQIKAPRQ